MNRCAAKDCRTPLPTGHPPWCSAKCRKRSRRGVDWSAHPKRHPNTSDMWEMRAEMDARGGKGRCIFCEGPISVLRRLHCGSEQCTADYHHLYDVAKRAAKAEKKRAA